MSGTTSSNRAQVEQVILIQLLSPNPRYGGIKLDWRAGVKVVCPVAEASTVLSLLDRLGVHHASIYPTYANVLLRLQDRRSELEDFGAPRTLGEMNPADLMSAETEEWLDSHWGGDPGVY